MCLTVQVYDGKTLTFPNALFVVWHLKSLIQEKTGIPVSEQNIVSDSVLKDDTVVSPALYTPEKLSLFIHYKN